MKMEMEKPISPYHKTEFKVEEIEEGEDLEKKRRKEILRGTYGNEVVNRIIAILYSAGIEELEGKYVSVEFKDGVIDSVKIVESPEEKDDSLHPLLEREGNRENIITFKVNREGLRDEIEKKIYEAINEMKLSLDHDYWEAYREAPDVVLNAYLGRMRGMGL